MLRIATLLILTILSFNTNAAPGNGNGSGSTTSTLSGTVSGLNLGNSFVLRSGKYSKTIRANGPYSINNGGSITISTQPTGQICTVIVTDVTCQNVYTVGGTVSGLTATLTLKLNNTVTNLIASGQTAFTFSNGLTTGTPYTVSITQQPSGLVCSILNPSGIIGTSNVTNVGVPCVVPTYTVGGTVTGLNGSLTLVDNGTDTTTVTADGPYTFSTALPTNASYAVAVTAQPVQQSCTLTNSTGTVATTDITNVAATCTNISGAVSLSWSQPTLNTDGTTLTDLVGYRLYYGTDPNNMIGHVDILGGSVLAYTKQGLTIGQLYYFRISSVALAGGEGPVSNAASGNAQAM